MEMSESSVKYIWSRKRTTVLLVLLLIVFVPKSCDCDEIKIPLLNKCCPDGTKYDFETRKCLSVNGQYETLLFKAPKNIVLFISRKDINSSVESFPFKLKYNSNASKCIDGSFLVQIKLSSTSLNNKTDSESNGEPTYKLLSNNSFNLISLPMFTPSGQLKIQKEDLGVNSTEYFSQPEYCLASFLDDTVIIRVCNPTCSGNTPCIRKCCDLDHVWNQARGSRQKCAPAGQHHWTPILYKDPYTKVTPNEMEEIYPHYKIVHPRTWCNISAYKPVNVDQQDATGFHRTTFRIMLNGGVIRKKNRYDWNTTEQNPMFQCLDGRMNPKFLPASKPNQTEYSGDNELDSIIFECGPPPPIEDSRTQTYVYGAAMIFSCFFLLIMIIVYILLFDRQRVHGWTIMSYATSLFFMYLFFVLMYFSNGQIVRQLTGRASSFCYFIGVALHFFFLSTFSWISMVNYDLWSTFRNLKPTSGRSKGFKRYMGYASFSFGIPIIIVSVALSLDSIYGDNFDSPVVVPEYAMRSCQLDPVYAQLYYAYGPAGVLLAINLVLFCTTIYSMYKIQQSTKFATSSSSKSQQQKQSIRLFAKLLFVMGIPWIFEIISSALENGKKTQVPWYWVFFDLVNIFQAIAIFYIFVCKQDIIHSLEQKYPKFKSFLNYVLLDTEKSDRIITTYPKLKGFIKLITRRQLEQTSAERNHTQSSYAGESIRRDKDDFHMRSNPSTTD